MIHRMVEGVHAGRLEAARVRHHCTELSGRRVKHLAHPEGIELTAATVVCELIEKPFKWSAKPSRSELLLKRHSADRWLAVGSKVAKIPGIGREPFNLIPLRVRTPSWIMNFIALGSRIKYILRLTNSHES